MEKDFDGWNAQKKKIGTDSTELYFETREVWWCFWGVNVGWEQDGGGPFFQRPIVVLKKMSRRTCLVAPLTTSIHKHPMRLSTGHIRGIRSHAVLSQIKVIDINRFVEKMGVVDEEYFNKIRKTIKDML